MVADKDSFRPLLLDRSLRDRYLEEKDRLGEEPGMPLDDGYGVLVGLLESWDFNHGGEASGYTHCTLVVKAGRKRYRCPVDLDSKHLVDGIEWRVVVPARALFAPVASLGEGWHFLRSAPGSGALDYYRSPELFPSDCRCSADLEPAVAEDGGCPWLSGTGKDAYAALKPLLSSSRRIFVFGEPFRRGRGVHNIHQNQGDPEESRWRRENGFWQDGGIISVGNDDALVAFLCKFKTQCFFPGH